MPIFRGHHLICLHFFNGEGYNAEFIENLATILEAARDADIEVCHGADNICKKCPSLKEDTCQYSQGADNEIKTMDNMALDLLGAVPGDKLGWQQIKERLPLIFKEWHGACCVNCGWRRVCEENDSYRELTCTLKP